MSSVVIVDNDALQFSSQFGSKTVTVTGAALINGSGEATINNKKMCIVGDEKKVSISANYTKAPYTIPGTGTISIAALAVDQQAIFATAQTPVIVEGSQFTASLTVITPAMDPSNSTPDPSPTPESGTGTFHHSQSFVTAG